MFHLKIMFTFSSLLRINIKSLLHSRQCPITIAVRLFSSTGSRKKAQHRTTTLPLAKKQLPHIKVWRGITEKELAHQANRTLDEIEDAMEVTNVTSLADMMDLKKVVKTLGYRMTEQQLPKSTMSDREQIAINLPKATKLETRPPVVTIMGHVGNILDQNHEYCQ